MEMGYVEDVEAEYERLKDVTDPLSTKVKLGSLISEKAAIEAERQVNHTIKQGAKLAFGGKREGAFYFPTVLTDVTKEMDVAKDMEIFAPVMPIIGFDTAEEAVEIANGSSYGLSGAVFTNNYKLGMQVAQALQSGGVVINGTTMYRNQMQPFGGYKMSGMGREGFVTLGEMMQEKVIVFKNFLA
jgi:succinate-semialdehyde dehydrogenase/glutarate-semialdehyde dehydrogenase